MAKLKPYAISFLGGIVYSLAWPTSLGSGLIATAIPGMAMLLYPLLQEEGLKEKFLIALAFCLPFTLIGFYWIPDTLAEFGNLPYPVALLLGTLFTFISAPQLYLFVLFAHSGIQRPRGKELWKKHPGAASALIAAILIFIEYFTPQQFTVLIGQPWGKLGPYLGLANVGGLPMFGFFSFLAAMELVNWARFGRANALNCAAVALFALANPLMSGSVLGEKPYVENPKQLNIRLVQANISNFLKVDSESGSYASVSEVLNRYRELSERPYEQGELDLLVWPETAYPFGIETSKEDLQESVIPAVFQDIAFLHDADLFIGGYDVIDSNGSFYQSEYNSNFHFNRDGKLENVYHKHILIPFGETLPFGPLNEYISRHIDTISFFSEGKDFPLFTTATGHRFINTICYEILKPEFVRDYLNNQKRRPHALVNLTNDSWYGNTSEPEQHRFLASWRALEFNLPIIRSTNTGISTYMDASGQEVKRLGVGETGNLDLSVQLGLREATFFQRFGFWTLLPVWFALFIFHWLLIRFKR